ncbi:MAG TPA: DNA sulfur modification protein DndD [Bacteroidia bacterium]|nr:DNA sulfur modification protein DndD [Bacteroidia bacterium]HRS58538.1 DNA sulfur modification protein DndD [Bacteroidia bacterium]
MKFRRITIENYKSFQFPVTINFPDSSEGKSIFLIGGMNGAGKTSLMEAINICLYGANQNLIYRAINRKELAKGNAYVSFELVLETDNLEEVIVKRSWTAGTVDSPSPKDLEEKLVVIKDDKRVSVQNKDMWQDYIDAIIPKSITQFFFFDGEKIQEIAADDHSEVRLKSSLEAALGIQHIAQLANDVLTLKQNERKNFVEISDEDINFKESELKREKAKLSKKQKEREEIESELNQFKVDYEEAKKRFQAAFNVEPENAEETKKRERKKIQLASKRGQLEAQIKTLIDKHLPWALAGKLFEPLKEQIKKEREAQSSKAIVDQAQQLAKDIVSVVDHPEPIYPEPLTEKQRSELEKRVVRLLQSNKADTEHAILNLSDRDIARVLNKIEEIEQSELFALKDFIAELNEMEEEIRQLDRASQGASSDTEKQLFEQLQQQMESCQNQIGRLTVKLQNINEEVITIENRIKEIELELDKLYDKHHMSREKVQFINECDAIANLLNTFTIRLRKNKIHLLQEKTFEMYKLLSSKSGLIKDLEIDEKTYEIFIRDRNGHEMKKSGLSAGEKEIFAVSLLWGLAQTSQLNLPIVIDTPLSRLDSVHRDKIVNNYFPNAAEQVIILSTDTEIDNNYFKSLEPHLSGAGKLIFNQINELTTFQEGYFWN